MPWISIKTMARLSLWAVLTALILMNCASQPKPSPRLIIDDSVAGDFRAIATETWAQFLAAFQGRLNCFGDVHLSATETLNSRAGYFPEEALVIVRVPATAAILKGALVHEWAHHVEFQCETHRQLRPDFLAAQGLPLDTPWRPELPPHQIPQSAWADIPSEMYAEAAIEVVLGSRQVSTGVKLSRDAVRVVRQWGLGN